jgi:hypothetical protein
MRAVGLALSEPGTGGHAHHRDTIDGGEFAIPNPSEAVHRHAHHRYDAERSETLPAHAERDEVLDVVVAVDSLGISKGRGNRGGEGEIGNHANRAIRDQLDVFIGVGYHHGLGHDAKSACHGAGIMCWWGRCHLWWRWRWIEDAGIMRTSGPSTAPTLWRCYIGRHSLHRHRLALLLGFEILREGFVPQQGCLHLVHTISRGYTVSWIVLRPRFFFTEETLAKTNNSSILLR